MPQEFDQHGLPKPRKFEDDSPPPETRNLSGRKTVIRWVVGLLLVAVVIAICFESGLAEQGKLAIADSMLRKAWIKYDDGDLKGAIEQVSKAIEWAPDTPILYLIRGEWYSEANEFDAAIADCTRAIELQPSSPAEGYITRAHASLRQKQYTQAIQDLDMAVEHREPRDARPFNERAYARALAEVDLTAALADAEKAISFDPEQSHYLDTRGYLHYLLDHPEPALVDLNRAIKLGEDKRVHDLRDAQAAGASSKRVERIGKRWDEALAVMYHHRGLVHQKLGNKKQAETDLKRGDELGYNPAAGIH